jgi:hypothetical protein
VKGINQSALVKGETMRLDKDKLNELVSLPDDELWKKVIEIANGYGFNLPAKTPGHSELEKLRGVVGDGSKMNVAGAFKILSKYEG